MILTATLLVLTQLLADGSQPNSVSKPRTLMRAVPTVSGRVVTDLEKPLPGVVVTLQGTSLVTSTNAAGDFLLPLSDTKSMLLFKCQGYRDQLLPVAGGMPLTVKMYPLNRTAPVDLSNMPVTESVGKPAVLSYSEVPPSFPGGDAAYRKFVSQTAHYPESALTKGLSGTVFVSFVVDEQGRITDAEVARGCGNGFDEEALRVIRLMPWWNPGLVGGKPVRVSRTMPVPFVFRMRD